MASNQSGRQRSGRWSVYRQLVRWAAGQAARRAVREDVRRAILAPRQRTWTGPENSWFRHIEEWYPSLHQATYFIPPIHFYRTPLSVADVGGQLVLVRDNPPPRVRRRRQPINPPPPPPPLSPQVAGSLYAENPPNLQPIHVQDSDHRDDEAQQRCLRSLSEIPNEAMMVVSQLTFRKYLDNLAHPLQAANAQLPSARSFPQNWNMGDGESDILIIHRTHGIIVAEIKSVGGGQYFSDQSSGQKYPIIVAKVGQAIDQLIKQRAALRHLVSDLPNIRITLTLLLPNITRAQLSAALTTSPGLTQRLCQTLSINDIAQALDKCLCQDLLDQPAQWWAVLHGHGPDPCMTPDLYERLVVRFCGPATMVDVPTACPPRVVVRTLGDAVAETGLRFSTISLTRDQLEVLETRPQHLYLQGPPGTGKTLLLFFAALGSAQQGRKVVIMHTPGDVAVATLLYHQLASILGGTTAARLIHLHPCDFGDDDLDVSAEVATLRQQVGEDQVFHIIMDEVPSGRSGRQFLPWVTAVGSTWPQALLWMAGLGRRDNTAPDLSRRLPQWVTTTTLRVSLRCSPAVTAHVAQYGYDVINDDFIPRYVTPADPQHTAGPDVRTLRHTEGDDGHTEDDDDYLGCAECSNNVAAVIRELGVGQPGHRLQYRDVFILTADDGPAPRDGDVFVQRLRQHHRLSVHVVEVSIRRGGVMTTLSADDARQLASAEDDRIVITDMRAVQGLERRVVFVLGVGLGAQRDYVALSRSTAFLCIIR